MFYVKEIFFVGSVSKHSKKRRKENPVLKKCAFLLKVRINICLGIYIKSNLVYSRFDCFMNVFNTSNKFNVFVLLKMSEFSSVFRIWVKFSLGQMSISLKICSNCLSSLSISIVRFVCSFSILFDAWHIENDVTQSC